MAKLEFFARKLPLELAQFMFCWKRLKDGIFVNFLGSYEELNRSNQFLNSVHNKNLMIMSMIKTKTPV